ncbi:MAG TPA: PfkB family carbohydrate kinase [Polyangia bacterium]
MALKTTTSTTGRHLASDGRVRAPLLAIGGLDSSGGAGLVRDFLTATALGHPIHLVATAWTLQVPTPNEAPPAPAALTAVRPRAATEISADVLGVIAAVGPAAIKVGMVATADVARSLADVLAGQDAPIVYDPVLQASTGRSLFEGDVKALTPLLRVATLVTPNLDEAAMLSGQPVGDGASTSDQDAEGAARAAQVLLRAGARAVLIKGGHGTGPTADDLLITTSGTRSFSAQRLPGPSPRGTGCALATAIAAGLARGEPLENAVAAAKTWLHQAIANAQDRGGQRML